MEFGVESNWKIVVVPRNVEFMSPAPASKEGLSWKNKYGYVAVVGWGDNNMVSDGLNEAGLSFGGLWYEPGLQYQEILPGEEKRALAQTMAGAWILGNFSSVSELKQAINQVKMFGFVVPALGISPPAHSIVYDATGESVVMEFENGNVMLYDNPLGVLTNAPNFPWHLAHLRQFIGMTNENPKPLEMGQIKLIPTGHGAGLVGLPGDLTPPSRFVRLAITTHFASKPENASEALNCCQHIVNAFNIVRGMVVDKNNEGKIISEETTQFATFRDLKNKIMFFQTYNNVDLRKIDLTKIKFDGEKLGFIDMYSEPQIIRDVTDQIKQ